MIMANAKSFSTQQAYKVFCVQNKNFNDLSEKLYYLKSLNDNKYLSFWNDVNPFTGPDLRPVDPISDASKKCFANSKNISSLIVNIIIEVPQFSLAKMEVQKSRKHHPIAQDTRYNVHNKMIKEHRFYHQFPLFNYGFLPRTWESPLLKDKEVENLVGDDDPLDAIQISIANTNIQCCIGQIIPSKVIGCFCLIDQGVIDWKIIVLNAIEAQRYKIETVKDFEREAPGKFNAVLDWFKNIKTYEGKLQNRIFKDKIFGVDKALEVINNNYSSWRVLNNEQLQEDAYLNNNNNINFNLNFNDVKILRKIQKKYFMLIEN